MQRQYRLKNPEIVKAQRKRNYEKNGERYRESEYAYNKKYRQIEKERLNKIKQRYKFRKKNASGFYKFSQLEDRLKFYGYKCWICGDDYQHVDHVKPLARGGSNWPANLRPACAPCNTSKRDKWEGPFALPRRKIIRQLP